MIPLASGSMDEDTARTGDTLSRSRQHLIQSLVAFVAGAVLFFAASAVFIIRGGTPPSSTPVASVVGHAGWFVGAALVTIGAVGLLMGDDGFEAGLAGYLAIGVFGLGTLCGLQWATWAWVDVLAAQSDQYALILDTVIAPFGSGLSLMYGMLVGSGVGFLGWETRRTQLTHRFIGWIGVGIGVAAVLGNVAVLLSASKNVLFAGTTLLIPLVYVWVFVFALDLYRRQSD